MTGRRPAAPGTGAPAGTPSRPLSPAAVAAGPDSCAGHAWLLESFVRRTAGVSHAIAVTGDGLVLAVAGGEPADRSDQLAAVAAGLVSLAHATARVTAAGDPLQASVELAGGTVVARPLGTPGAGAVLVLTGAQADLGYVAYELTVLVSRVRRVLAGGGDGERDGRGGGAGPAGVRPIR